MFEDRVYRVSLVAILDVPRVRYTLPVLHTRVVYVCVFYGARVAYLKQGARMEYKVLWKTGIKKKGGEKRKKKKGRKK